MSKPEFTEADLQAYVDALGPESLRPSIEAYLAEHPQDAVRVGAYQAQRLALHEVFDSVLNEPVPESLRRFAMPPLDDPIALPRWSLQRIAASVLLAVAGGAVGWGLHDQFQSGKQSAQVSMLAHQAAIAHVVYSPDVRRPVEVGVENEAQLVTWLSKRMGTPVKPPKLGPLGFDLIGGRLLPGSSGPVAQFMYQDTSGQRLTLMVSTEITGNHDTAFRFSQEGAVNVFYWIDGQFGYALSAGIGKSDLSRVASAVYDQLDHK
jgi:anti-sigma factor RsiW